jgi:hypothetical protein
MRAIWKLAIAVTLAACGSKTDGGPLGVTEVFCSTAAIGETKGSQETFFGDAFCKGALQNFLDERPGLEVVQLVPLTHNPGTPTIDGTNEILVVYRAVGKYAPSSASEGSAKGSAKGQ